MVYRLKYKKNQQDKKGQLSVVLLKLLLETRTEQMAAQLKRKIKKT
jgi:hypothetical protein